MIQDPLGSLKGVFLKKLKNPSHCSKLPGPGRTLIKGDYIQKGLVAGNSTHGMIWKVTEAAV